jgi:hypothetical protein
MKLPKIISPGVVSVATSETFIDTERVVPGLSFNGA